MKTKPYTLFLHAVFLLSLGLLLLNDFYLKYQFHNWITGKLSDLAGLFSFAVFLSVFFPANKKSILILTGLLFLWWKSPLSEPLIFFLNNDVHLPVYRVVDYSDYIALLVLPAALYIKPMNYSLSGMRRVAITGSCILSFFAFIADSLPRRLTDDHKIQLGKHIRTKKSKDEIITAFERNGLKPSEVPAIYDRAWDRKYYVKTTNPDGTIQMTPIDSLYTGIYTKIDYGSSYVIPDLTIGNDTIQNLEVIISDFNKRKKDVEFHSFEYKKDSSSTFYSNYYNGYYTWRRFKSGIRKKFKSILK